MLKLLMVILCLTVSGMAMAGSLKPFHQAPPPPPPLMSMGNPYIPFDREAMDKRAAAMTYHFSNGKGEARLQALGLVGVYHESTTTTVEETVPHGSEVMDEGDYLGDEGEYDYDLRPD